MVKVRDSKAIESTIDTFHIHVYEKLSSVIYDGNGNTGGSVPNSSARYAQGQAVTVMGNTGVLVKTGYFFSGWNTKQTGGGASYSAGATLAMDSATVTLYAQWTFNPTYTITYNGGSSTSGTVPSDSASYSLGQNVTVLGNTGALAKIGYTFIGWNTQEGGGGIGYLPGVSFAMGTSNVTLYAQWTALATFTVTYDGNGNSGGTVPIDKNYYLTGATVTVLGNTGPLVKTGYTFIGWNTQADGGGISYAAGATLSMGETNAILYAQWTNNPTYTVVYNRNGGTGGSVPADNNNYAPGQTVTVRGAGTLFKTGYFLAGWNTQAGGGGTSYAAGSALVVV